MIEENLKNVEQNIANACKKAGRNKEDVTLICVSKTKPKEMIEEAYAFGKREFGENKAQEMKESVMDFQKISNGILSDIYRPIK